MSWQKRLSIAAWVALAVHLIANGTMALVLRNGLAVNSDLPVRLAFLASQRTLWIAGWLPWSLASFGIFAVFICFWRANAKAVSSPQLLKLAVFVCILAMCCDLAGQGIAMLVLPDAAQGALRQDITDPRQFNDYYNLVVMLSGGAGNLGYTAATLLCALPARALYPRWVTISAVGIGVLGVLETASCFTDSLLLQVVLNAALFPVLSLWLVGVALHANRPQAPVE